MCSISLHATYSCYIICGFRAVSNGLTIHLLIQMKVLGNSIIGRYYMCARIFMYQINCLLSIFCKNKKNFNNFFIFFSPNISTYKTFFTWVFLIKRYICIRNIFIIFDLIMLYYNTVVSFVMIFCVVS